MTSRLQRATLYLVFFYIQSRVPISSSDQGAACCCLTSVHRSWSYPQQSQCKIRTMSRWFKITSTSILLRFHNIGLHQTRVRFLSSGTNTITTSRPSRTESITTRNNTTIHWWWDEATKIDTWYYSRCLKLRCFNRFQSWFINISYQFGYQNIIIKYLNFNTIKYCDQTSIHQTSISQPPQNAGKSGHIIGSTNVLLGTLHGVARQLQQLPCETRWVGVSCVFTGFLVENTNKNVTNLGKKSPKSKKHIIFGDDVNWLRLRILRPRIHGKIQERASIRLWIQELQICIFHFHQGWTWVTVQCLGRFSRSH